MAAGTPKTVKARRHEGATSLDLTLPSHVCSSFGIKAGDIFSVVASRERGRITITYTRVYPED